MRTKTFLLLTITSILVVSCTYQKVWVYTTNKGLQSSYNLINKSCAIVVNDERFNLNENYTGWGYFPIPLAPYWSKTLNTPETEYVFYPSTQIAQAVVEELRSANIFKEVFITPKPETADYTMIVYLRSIYFNKKILTYFMPSYFTAWPLWLFLPHDYIKNSMVVKFELIRNKTGNVEWDKEVKKEFSTVHWIYSLGPDFFFDELFEMIMEDVLYDLRSFYTNYR